MKDSSEREKKCILQARKRLTSFAKHGKWLGIAYIILAILVVGLGLAMTYLVYKIFTTLAFNQQQQNAMWQGYGLGLGLGFMAGFMLYEGLFHLAEAIKYIRGNIADFLLIRYHDALINLMNEENEKKEMDNVNFSRPEK